MKKISILSSREYRSFIENIKSKIRTAQIKASFSVNVELIRLYWDIGRSVIDRQNKNGWGTSVIEQMARDIQKEFPGIEGFSNRNIWRMRAFYLAWTKECEKLPQPVAEIDGINPPQVVAQIPWGHNASLLEKVKDPLKRLWYASKIVEFGWSRPVLVHQIEGNAYSRQGKAVTNFKTTLPPPQSDLAKQIIKDPYNFDFLTLKDDYNEKILEKALIDEVQKFLLELGTGFSFVGRQMHLEVGEQDFYIDLLFYHLKLRCFVVIELKTEAFKPEFAGKMNFYLSAVDDLMRHQNDQPSIGIILCKTRNKVIAEYALRDVKKPVGVASYITRLVEKLPQKFEGMLPSVKEIEKELS
jgi:predicted nuclease of restriction endonuclease-like (RecB) superfamily